MQEKRNLGLFQQGKHQELLVGLLVLLLANCVQFHMLPLAVFLELVLDLSPMATVSLSVSSSFAIALQPKLLFSTTAEIQWQSWRLPHQALSWDEHGFPPSRVPSGQRSFCTDLGKAAAATDSKAADDNDRNR